MTTTNLFNRAGMSSGTSGTGTIALQSPLGAVAPNVCSFIDFAAAGATDGQTVSYLVLDSNGAWECGHGVYHSAGPTLSGRTVSKSSNSNAAINLSGTEQVFISALAEDLTSIAGLVGAFTLGAGLANNSNALLLDPSYLRNYLAGLVLSNDVTLPNTVLDVAAGVCNDSTNAVMIKLGAFKKSTAGIWSAGTSQNGMGTGLSVAASTWYHVFAIINSGAADVYFDTSVTAANAPVGTTAFRRIGSILTDGSSHILAFTQVGDHFMWTNPTLDVSNAGVASAVNLALSVPLGVSVEAEFMAWAGNNGSTAGGIFVYSPLTGTQVANPAIERFNVGSGFGASDNRQSTQLRIVTNTSQQVQAVASDLTSAWALYINTLGWIETGWRSA